jgi:hypothetical protein
MNTSFSLNYGLQKAGLPLIPVQAGKYDLCFFILDIGTTLSLLDSSITDKLETAIIMSHKKSFLEGVDGKYIEAEETGALSFIIGEQLFTLTFVCESLFKRLISIELNCDMLLHGIVGNDFLVKNKWIIDYGQMEVYFK